MLGARPWNRSPATNPEKGTATYTYNAVNQVLTRTDALQNQTKYTYDTYGRQTKVQHFLWNGSSLQEQTNQEWDYYYDTNPFVSSFSTNTWGRIAAVSFSGPNAPGTLSYQYNYNAAGRVLTQRFALPAMAPNPSGLNLDATYTWDNQGRVTQMAYPQSGPTYAYGFDVMGRATSMKENGTQMATVGYNWASQITSMTYDAFSDTRTYDPQTMQLTRLTTQNTTPSASTILDMSYVYNAGQNNGQIAQSIDHVLNETVNYTYDPLKRLATAQATSGAWGQTFTYDGFGNLTATAGTGAAPSLSLTIDPGTNRGFAAGSTTQYYDANGNAQGPNAAAGNPYTYDIANRLLTGGYTYDPSGKRVLQETLTSGNITQLQIYFYSISGQRIATYKSVANGSGGYTQSTSSNLFFGGKQIRVAGATVATDRLGSVRANASGVQFQYWPYGQERTSTPNGQEKFGTYFRDDGYLDYADQRYFYATGGRFWTPDPSGAAAAHLGDPSSLNMYEYVGGDPINQSDPTGLCGVSSGDNATDDALRTRKPGRGGSGGFGTLDDCGGGFVNYLPTWGLFGIPVVDSTFSPITETTPEDNQDVAMGDIGQAVLPIVYQTTAPLTQVSTWSQIGGGSLIAGTGVAAGLTIGGTLGLIGAAAPPVSILYGDIQASFNFGASVQPTITSTIEGSQVYSTAAPASNWVTTEVIGSGQQATSILSLPPYNLATTISSATVTPGATIVSGTAAPLFGQLGGGMQIFVQPVAGGTCIVFGPGCGLP
ncbi:MAG TPA: RHS repeat-associated core domain-containing protein [Bryobacteraceae bacterium]|jgi:RHS repeat-associated protein|nr:RHS repeat-associated core domain-containing protein [Bryobacteraceae bacterium]